MKRLHINEIILGNTYYQVVCGNISKVIFKEINIPKIITYYPEKNFQDDEYLSDIGIKYPNESYINHLNRVFETKKEAEEFITNIDYQAQLKKHRDLCYFWPDF